MGLKGKAEVLLCFTVLLAAFFFLAPRGVDPVGSECEQQWVAARILGETGGFPVMSLGPLYVVYLQAFRWIEYPSSVQLEHVITVMLVCGAVLFMLRRFWGLPLALLVVCAWLPYLAVLNPGSLLMGIGFLCLYLRGPEYRFNRGYIPLPLLAALLCHSSCSVLLFGHIAGECIRRRRAGLELIGPFSFVKEDFIGLLAKLGLFVLLIAVVFMPSKRWDHNHMLIESTYCPVPLNNAMTIGFFQIGTWKEVERTIPEVKWVDTDWYSVTPLIYKGAVSVLQAVIRAPADRKSVV